MFLAVVGGVALGYFGGGIIGSTDTKLEFPDRGYSPSTFSLGCDVITEGTAFENRLDGPTANVRGGLGKDKVALNLSQDGQTLSVLYAYDVGHGGTVPIKLDVHSKSDAYIMAEGQQLLGETAVILDVKTGKAVISFTGQGMVGIKGSSYLMQCS
jgi:hypothetical protein